ncbi:MAG TPA: lectin like domain-containing protein [Candidatus Saccharicenans sp.]|nr:lectin like domain-containing protein [Candidatus Saccharicenans sp.]
MKIQAEQGSKSLFLFLKKKRIPILVLFFIIVGLGTLPGVATGEDRKLSMAPLDKTFLEYISRPPKVLHYTAEGHPLGLIPGPRDLSYLKTGGIPRAKAVVALPASYDLRTLNKVTPVRNQGSCGSCWAFATYGSLESFLMPAEPRDFSEEHLIHNHGFDYGPCYGGTLDMATAYLARWGGPVNETDDPYVSGNGYSVAKHVQEVMMIPPRSGPLDNSLVKQAIMDYGAVYVDMVWDDSSYNSTYKAYYNPGNTGGGHAVAIVGWDDNFEASKFNTAPAGNGAFIVKNSWGANWGDHGYFYVSYYDAYFGRRGVNGVVKAENPGKYVVNYQYDPLGWIYNLGYAKDTAWMANIFQAQAGLPIEAVSFYTSSTENYYEIYIYVDVASGQPRSGELKSTKSGSINSLGYFTVELDNPVALTTGQYFSVVLKLRTVGYNYPIPAEGRIEGYTSAAVSNPGMGFVSEDGVSWEALNKYFDYDICLKAFAGLTPIYPPINLRLASLENNFIFFKEKINRLTWAANPANGTNIVSHKIYRKASNESTFSLLATVSGTQYTFDDRGLKNPGNYSYQVTVVDEYERESDPATVSGSAETPAKVLKTKSYRTKVAPKNLVDSK